jgi:hypothetical protein
MIRGHLLIYQKVPATILYPAADTVLSVPHAGVLDKSVVRLVYLDTQFWIALEPHFAAQKAFNNLQINHDGLIVRVAKPQVRRIEEYGRAAPEWDLPTVIGEEVEPVPVTLDYLEAGFEAEEVKQIRNLTAPAANPGRERGVLQFEAAPKSAYAGWAADRVVVGEHLAWSDDGAIDEPGRQLDVTLLACLKRGSFGASIAVHRGPT